MATVFYLTAQQVLAIPQINYTLQLGETVALRGDQDPDRKDDGAFFAVVLRKQVKLGRDMWTYTLFPFTAVNVGQYLRGLGETVPASYRGLLRQGGQAIAIGDPKDLERGF